MKHIYLFTVSVFLTSTMTLADEPAKIVKMALGENFSCALFDIGKIKCWGQGSRGKLGNGQQTNIGIAPNQMGAALPYIDLGTSFKAISVTAGNDHVCALSAGGKVKCWGSNDFGALGLGGGGDRGVAPNQMGDNLPYVDLGDGIVTDVVTQKFSTCAIFSDGRLKCWGRNTNAQLGLEDTLPHGETPSQMGAGLPYVNLGSGVKVKAIFPGWFHTCALTTENKLKCWGDGEDGATGQENPDTIGAAAGSMGNALKYVDVGGPIVDFCSSILHNCAVLADRSTRCFGYEDSIGRLGNGSHESTGYQPNSMGANIPTTPLSSGFATKSLSCGWRASCAILENDGLKCWGANDAGGIGLGARGNVGSDRGDMGDNLPYVNLGTNVQAQSVFYGGLHACVLTKTGHVKCFGNNNAGQLGLGDTVNRGRSAKDMGDNLPYVKLQ